MSRSESSSIWDRLSQTYRASRPAPRSGAGDRPSRFGPTATRDFKQAVCRDLEALLNTRRPLHPDAAAATDESLRRSLATYGIPDFTGAYMGSREQREMFRRELQRAIVLFEPRIHSVRVTEIEPKDAASAGAVQDRTLRYRINGIIRNPSAGRGYGGSREEAVFETRIEPMTCGVAVERTK